MRIIHVDQNSDEWFKEREGKITGSRVANVFISKLANKDDILAAVIAANNVSDEDLKEYKKTLKAMPINELEELLPRNVHEEMFHKAQKKEYWRILAERLGYSDLDDDGLYEDPRERGHRLEDSAAKNLEEKENVKTVVVGMCVRDDYEYIAISPDRLIPRQGTSEEDLELFLAGAGNIEFEGGVEIKNPGVANHLQIIFTNEVPSEYWEQCIQYFVVTDIDYLYFVSNNPHVKEHPLHIIKIERKDVLKEIEESLRKQIDIVEHLNQDIIILSF